MSEINLKPLSDRLVVEPIEEAQRTASGLVLPDTAKEKPQRGKVLAAGPGRQDDNGKRMAMDVSVGDVVLFAKYSGTEFKRGERKLLILNEADVLALIEQQEE
jgi:chaperonin GroES